MVVLGGADAAVRSAVFAWLTNLRDTEGAALSWRTLQRFPYQGRHISLVGMPGIWKPAGLELPISIRTSPSNPYRDGVDDNDAFIHYRYRRTGTDYVDNRLLRRAREERVPLVYFRGFEGPLRAFYVAAYPAFILEDDPASQTFLVQVDSVESLIPRPEIGMVAEEGWSARREYVTRSVRQRMHQDAFRTRVIQAYREQCALCHLRHQELLDAAHIVPDSHPDGLAAISNGMSLCKLHHAAYDKNFFSVRPDYQIEVRPSILAESDGPMLVVGLQQIHGTQILLPRRAGDRPDPVRLSQRYEGFKQAS